MSKTTSSPQQQEQEQEQKSIAANFDFHFSHPIQGKQAVPGPLIFLKINLLSFTTVWAFNKYLYEIRQIFGSAIQGDLAIWKSDKNAKG